MLKFLVNIPVDYIIGHLRYGHFEGTVRAENEEDARKKIQKMFDEKDFDFELLIDDYEIDDYGEVNIKDAIVEEING